MRKTCVNCNANFEITEHKVIVGEAEALVVTSDVQVEMDKIGDLLSKV